MISRLLSELPQVAEQLSGWPWSGPSPAVIIDPAWPKISVITFVHNHVSAIEATIRSVLIQGYPNLEYIVVDGGSTDGSLDVIRKYEHWLTLLDDSHTLIQAFQRASGDVLSWLNSGDLYTPDALQIAARRLTGASKGLLVGSAIFTHSPDTLDGEIAIRWPSWEKMVYESASFPQSSVFWTRDLWDAAATGLVDQPDLALDYYLGLQMFHLASKFIPEALVLSYSRTPSQWGAVQHAYAAVAAAKQRRANLLVWLIKLWLYRARLAIWKRKPDILIGSRFHQTAARLIIFPHR